MAWGSPWDPTSPHLPATWRPVPYPHGTGGAHGGGHPEVPTPKATQTPAPPDSPHLPRQPPRPPGPVPAATKPPLGGSSASGTSRLRPPASAAPPPPAPPRCAPLPGMGGHPLTCHWPPAPTAPIVAGSGPRPPAPQETPCCSSSAMWAPQMGPPITGLGRGWPTLGADGPRHVMVAHAGCRWPMPRDGGQRRVPMAHAA